MVPSYYRPSSPDEAIRLKAELGSKAVFLAGGTEVNNGAFPRPEVLIDLAGLGLNYIERSAEGIRLGAGVTFQQLLEHPEVPAFLKRAASQMVNRNIRNRATVGGQLGANRSCADLIPTLLVAEARVQLNEALVPLDAYLMSAPTLALSVFIPADRRSFASQNYSRTAADISIVGAAVSVALSGNKLIAPKIAVGGVAPHVVRLNAVEEALNSAPLPDSETLEAMVSNAVHPVSDHRGSAEFKRHMAAVLAARTLREACGRFNSGEGVY